MSDRIGEVLDRIEAQQAEAAEPFDGNAHDLLVATYQGRYRPTPMQLRAAALAIQYESPKLAVTAYLGDADDFAARLDRALQRSGLKSNPKLIEHQPKSIDQ
jgi:hypothetical protein